MIDVLQTTGVAVTCEAVKADLLQQRARGPRRRALLDFFAEAERIARGRRGPLKPQGKGNPGGKPCQPKD